MGKDINVLLYQYKYNGGVMVLISLYSRLSTKIKPSSNTRNESHLTTLKIAIHTTVMRNRILQEQSQSKWPPERNSG